MRVLILGGTLAARHLADRLVDDGFDVITSLAGRTKNALLPAGQVHIGGFGGIAGLSEYLRVENIDALINATHPFAAQMSRHAVAASSDTGVPVLRLTRPSWAERADAREWTWVDSHQQAAEVAALLINPDQGSVLLTVGRQHSLDYQFDLADRRVVCRVALALDEIPPGWDQIVTRGPFSLTDEIEVFSRFDVCALVTKDSGGDETSAKLDAAKHRGIPVIMVRRPDSLGETTTDPDEAVTWLRRLRSTRIEA